MDSHHDHCNYFARQAGGDVQGYYAGGQYMKGSGIGSILGRVFKSAIPLITRTAKTFGKRALKSAGKHMLNTGMSLASDLIEGQSLQDSLRHRGKEVAQGVLSDVFVKSQKPRKRKAAGKSSRKPAKKRKTKGKVNQKDAY